MNAERPERRRSTGWLLVVVAAILPSVGTLTAPLVSDDGAILGYVHQHGPFSDWLQPEYGLRTVRFWRPLVTTTWDVQESLSGANPLPLRCFNLACHAVAAVLLGAIALALGAGHAGALAAGLLFAVFPHQGGNVTWIAGRVDSLCLPLFLGACVAALRLRRLLSFASLSSFLLAFLSLATKELAIAVAPIVLLLAWALHRDLRAAARAALPALVATAVAVVWRRLALGVWIGGYPQPPLDLSIAFRAVFGWVEVLRAPFVFAFLALGLALLVGARTCGRADSPESPPERTRTLLAFLAALFSAALAAVPVVHVLIATPRSPLHFRTLALSDAFLCLAVSLALAPAAAWRRARSAVAAGALVLCAIRGVQARQNVLDWAEGGRVAEAHVAGVRAALRGSPASDRPVLDTTAPRITPDGRAYVLLWGVADRFRAPFESTPRPVWPWRPVFGTAASERAPPRAPQGEFVDPFLDSTSPPLGVRLLDRGREVDVLSVDSRLIVVDGAPPGEPPPMLELAPLAPGTRLELVLVTEQGYEPAPLERAAPAAFSLRDALLARVGGGDLFLWQVLAHTADLGARRAYLEVRAIESGAASRWIPLTWEPEVRDLLSPR